MQKSILGVHARGYFIGNSLQDEVHFAILATKLPGRGLGPSTLILSEVPWPTVQCHSAVPGCRSLQLGTSPSGFIVVCYQLP